MKPSGAELGDTGVGDYEANPTRYVSRYGANYFHEDIADTFAVFVLGGRSPGETRWPRRSCASSGPTRT